MKIFTLLILFNLSLISFGQKKQVCFSVDDLPFVSYEITDTVLQKGLVDKLLFSLVQYKIPAIGFVIEKKLYDNRGIFNYQVEFLKNGLLKVWIWVTIHFLIQTIILFHFMITLRTS